MDRHSGSSPLIRNVKATPWLYHRTVGFFRIHEKLEKSGGGWGGEKGRKEQPADKALFRYVMPDVRGSLPAISGA